jgi:serine/threonine protein kinase
MDRQRLVKQIRSKGVPVGSETLKIVRELGSGGNGVAFLCQATETDSLVAKVYIPPDSRDLDERAYKRFKNEISLISKMQHPNVIKALGSGIIEIGAYSLPFYTMPFAPGTLRQEITTAGGPDHLERKLRIFLRAVLGVAALHSQGIVHRDLKPENILISDEGTPWVADLGIARVSAQLATTGVKTMASERLRNQDYYAPEQRFGSAIDVDHRADIYALGCILYELISGTPPVRVNSPKLQTISDSFSRLDSVIDRMTAFNAEDRYFRLEDVVEDLSVNIGVVLSTHESGLPPVKTDRPSMIKFMKSSNDAIRQRGIEVARRLGNQALPDLHDLLGNRRREVRNAAAAALGQIAAPASLPYLIGALYGITENASRFRPSADTASQALALFPTRDRLKVIDSVSQPIRPSQILQIVHGLPRADAYSAIQSLAERKLILLDWGESVFELFVVVDEARVWPELKKAAQDGDVRNSFRVRRFIGYLTPAHQVEFMTVWLNQDLRDSYTLEAILNLIPELQLTDGTRLMLLQKLQAKIESYRGVLKDRDILKARIGAAISSMNNH